MIDLVRRCWRAMFPPAPTIESMQAEIREKIRAMRPPARIAETHTVALDRKQCKIVGLRRGCLDATFCLVVPRHHWRKDDFVLFVYQSGESTRYRITRIEILGGMMFFDAVYAPRGTAPDLRLV